MSGSTAAATTPASRFTQCYVSFGDPDGEDFAFTKCDANGNFSLSGLPDGDWRITVFDQWNDMLVDGLSTPVRLAGGATVNLGRSPPTSGRRTSTPPPSLTQRQWRSGPDEAGLALVATNIRFRDGSYSNFNNTDLNGNAGFNEIFPLFSWYVVETDSTRYKNTGIHVVYDAGGPADGTTAAVPAPSAETPALANLANTIEADPGAHGTAGTGRVLLRHCGLLRRAGSPFGRNWLRNGWFYRPRRSSVGLDRRLAGILRPEQLHRIR